MSIIIYSNEGRTILGFQFYTETFMKIPEKKIKIHQNTGELNLFKCYLKIFLKII